jgi:HEPN domain-containing protein
MSDRFSWPSYPKNEHEFDALMRAIDEALAARGLTPAQRPLNVPFLLGSALGWSGNVLADADLAKHAGYTGDVLMAKAHRWYEEHYGKKLNIDFGFGAVPYRLANAVWLVRLARTWGTVRIFADRNLLNRGTDGITSGPASYNALCAVEDLPQPLINSIENEEIARFHRFYIFAHENLQWHSGLTESDLFRAARDDYSASTTDLLSGRYGLARWGAQQAAEKTIKGLLAVGGTNYPTGGRDGHDLIHLANLLRNARGAQIRHSQLVAASCSPRVRYGEELSSEEQALTANHAVLAILDDIRRA